MTHTERNWPARVDTAALRALAEAATPGPLEFRVFPKSRYGPGHLIIHAPDGPRWMQVAFVPRPPDILDTTWQRLCDTYRHFAAARTAVPQMCDELDTLHEQIAKLREMAATSPVIGSELVLDIIGHEPGEVTPC